MLLRRLRRPPVPRGLRKRLAALGYVASGPTRSSRDRALPDPKDCIGPTAVNLRSDDRGIGSASISDRVRCDRAIHVRSHMDRSIPQSEIADR